MRVLPKLSHTQFLALADAEPGGDYGILPSPQIVAQIADTQRQLDAICPRPQLKSRPKPRFVVRRVIPHGRLATGS